MIELASDADLRAFLSLAAEVEDWFGPMVDEPGFHAAVQRNIARHAALVARDSECRVVGALLFDRRRAPTYDIGWLVVAAAHRSQRVGESLLAEAVRRWVVLPATVEVVTFGVDHPGARSRRFYERLGFVAAEPVEAGPEGGSRQRFRLELDHPPTWAS